MNDDKPDKQADALDVGFDALRQQMQEMQAPADLEGRLLAAFNTVQAQRVPSVPSPLRAWYQRSRHWISSTCAIAGTAALVVTMMISPVRTPMEATSAVRQMLNDETGTPFIAIASLERIEGEPAPRLVDADVPGSWLASLGLPVAPEMADEPVHAQMLLSESGQPLAMRLAPH
ncbi:hypothetical protein [Undibacterium terreum]|uniref:Uncharacterized protein n=1 Tax=Undibacterium terreum TaxID=1224302 RepID=A0A916V1N6_9BURK|nr:hypothetical protein [Undibacterium terreum]GGD00961.1 hypothetical protein GCM10011396_55690 [Undibacterium terreum]